MIVTPLPRVMIEPAVRVALLEDLGRAGDLTTDAIVPAETVTRTALVARQAGVVAGLDFAAAAFRLIDPAIEVIVALPDGNRLRPGDLIATITRAGPRHFDGGTNSAEFPLPPQRRRVRHARHRRCHCGHAGAGLLHAQDDAGAALRTEIRRAGGRRIEPPIRPG